ncbi:hypothetical protein ACFL6C_10015 [Myxococcota bacterium]
MAITRKPKAEPAPNVDVDALINKGGSVTRLANAEANQKQVYVQLRLPKELVDQIDKALSTRSIKTPRHTWFLEAIHEKLERGG